MPRTYTLMVAGLTSPRALAERMGFAVADFHVADGVWTADLCERHGVRIRVQRGQDAAFGRHTAVVFGADRELPRKAWWSAARLAERVLEGGEEDLAFLAFGDRLVFERVGGVVRRCDGDFERRDPASIVFESVDAEHIVGTYSDVEVRSVLLLLRQASDRRHPLWDALHGHVGLADRIAALRPRHRPEVYRPMPEEAVGALLTEYRHDDVPLDERLLESADRAALGWARVLGPDDARAAVTLLLEVARDPAHPLVPDLEDGFRWDDDARTWAWFGHFARRLADRVETLLQPPGDVAQLFARHFGFDAVWGATREQLLFAADTAARDAARAPAGARGVAGRLRALAEDRRDPLVLEVEFASGYPWTTHWDDHWPELQAVARRIADRIDARVP